MDSEQILFALRNLIDTMPNFYTSSRTPEAMTWLARVAAVVETAGAPLDRGAFAMTMDDVIGENDSFKHARAVEKVRSILFRTFARAELKAPSNIQGSYIPAGNAFDALAAIGRVFGTAKIELLVVDPYSDEKLLRDFAPLAAEGVRLNILADTFYVKPSFKPAVDRWLQQFKNRLLEARLTPARRLHDRLIIVDDKEVWIVTQSFKDLAERAPASVTRFEADSAELKLNSYRAMWAAAQPI